MNVSTMTIDEHDKIMSITSHLPHLIAFTIVGTAFGIDLKRKRDLINFSAGGFKDFTRIGSSDPKMWTDIFIKNKKHLLKTLENFLKDIDKIKKLIVDDEVGKIFSYLKRNKKIRKSIMQLSNLKRD
jgi:prephenate dehydrogenase